nr:hypothetical protein F15A8.2 - Caenorhabditis elegans [Caenorhabditis elegans]
MGGRQSNIFDKLNIRNFDNLTIMEFKKDIHNSFKKNSGTGGQSNELIE